MGTSIEPLATTDEEKQQKTHEFHATAHVLSGELKGPIQYIIDEHAPVAMKDERGGHHKQTKQDVNIEGLISFKTGHSRVSGHKSPKEHRGWITLSTSVMEGLNVFEVLTADRVVAQVSTEHPYVNGHVPHVNFLGTRFENLQVAGFPIRVNLNLEICGKRPAGDKPYLTDSGFLGKIQEQVSSVANADFLPGDVKKEYRRRLDEIMVLRSSSAEVENLISPRGESNDASPRRLKVTCSLVNSIDVKDIPIPGLKTVGNVLFIPEFGAVALAEVEVGTELAESKGFKRHVETASNGNKKKDERRVSHYFNLKMIDMTLGCVGHGNVIVNSAMANGNTKP